MAQCLGNALLHLRHEIRHRSVVYIYVSLVPGGEINTSKEVPSILHFKHPEEEKVNL
jgi:hypothetical protein